MRVAFLGPAGTFTEEALLADPPGDIEPVPHASVPEVVMAVESGSIERGIVPLENSLEGSLAATLDALAVDAPSVRIVRERVHPIHHCLVAAAGTGLDAVSRVVSHPQATAQCARFLRERLPGVELGAATSTAEAVRAVVESGEPWVALGSRLAAELYGGVLLAERVEDRDDNVTRFVHLARGGPADSVDGAPLRTSIVFWGFNDRSAGALVAVLRELSDRGVNLTKIESRPRRAALGHYMFFADLDGGEHEGALTEGLEALAKRVETVRVLGSYPVV